jgi:hypothetical protein
MREKKENKKAWKGWHMKQDPGWTAGVRVLTAGTLRHRKWVQKQACRLACERRDPVRHGGIVLRRLPRRRGSRRGRDLPSGEAQGVWGVRQGRGRACDMGVIFENSVSDCDPQLSTGRIRNGRQR